jgi:hypothetical protein
MIGVWEYSYFVDLSYIYEFLRFPWQYAWRVWEQSYFCRFLVISMNSEDSGLRLFRWIRVARKRVVVVVVVVVARSPCVPPTRDSCNAASFRSECLLQDRTLQLLQMVLGSCCAALRESKLSFDREEDFGRIRPGFGRRNWTRFLHFPILTQH